MLRAIGQRSLRNLIYRAEYQLIPAVKSKSRYPPLIDLKRKGNRIP
jgi:hypothetical protein